MSKPSPVARIRREPLGSHGIEGGKHVDRVEAHRLTLPPGGRTGVHSHPVPVVSAVVEGRIVMQIEGEPARTFDAGEAIFEPPHVRIARFDNASSSEQAIFVASYLLGHEDGELIHMEA